MLAWLAVQRSKDVFFLILYDSINDMKHFLTVCITPQPCHSHFVVVCCKFGINCLFGLKMELMAYADLVDGTMLQRLLFTDLI